MDLAKEAGDASLLRALELYGKHSGPVDDKVYRDALTLEETCKDGGSADRKTKAGGICPSMPELWTGAGRAVCADHEGSQSGTAGTGRKGHSVGSPSGGALCACQ